MGQNHTTQQINESMNGEVADKKPVPSKQEALSSLKIEERKAYIEADAYVADPYALLGQVIQVRKSNDGQCPTSFNDPSANLEFTPVPIKRKINENSKLKKPEIRSQIIVDQSLATSVSFLSYLSAQLNSKSIFSITLYDQAAGLIDTHDEEWPDNLRQWKTDNHDLFVDPQICYLFVVTGFIQKNLIRKKYIKFEAGAKGGAYGINVNGELATSTEEYSLDIWFGLEPAILKRPDPTYDFHKTLLTAPTKSDIELFASATGSTASNLVIRQKITLG
jgi:hypothetical protein